MANPTLEDGTLARRKPIGEALGSKDTLLHTIPVGQHNTTPPNLADGDVAVLQMDDMGNIKVAFGDPAQEAMLNQIQNAIDTQTLSLTLGTPSVQRRSGLAMLFH